MAHLQRSLNVVVTSLTLCFISCCANAGRREQSPKRCETLSSQLCTRTREGDRSDCNHYRGISLLCVAGKLFARVALNFIAFSSLQKECTLSLSVVFDPNAQRLI